MILRKLCCGSDPIFTGFGSADPVLERLGPDPGDPKIPDYKIIFSITVIYTILYDEQNRIRRLFVD